MPEPHMEELDEDECRKLLAERHLGRLAFVDFGGPVIFPVNYVFDQDLVIFRTDPGSKLDAATERESVAFEVDATDEATRTGWSVVVRGTLADITDPAHLEQLRPCPLPVGTRRQDPVRSCAPRSAAAASESPMTCPSPGGADRDMTERLGAADRPLRIAIIEAGPAGLYAVDSLLRKRDISLTIDVLMLPHPVRAGPRRGRARPPIDQGGGPHLDKILADPRVRYFGNVTYGVDIHHRKLKRLYHQLVYAVGAQADRRMSIPGEDLPNSHPPSPSSAGPQRCIQTTAACPWPLGRARPWSLATATWPWTWPASWPPSPDELARTDIADHALGAPAQPGPRGPGAARPAQASFTTPRSGSWGRLQGVDVIARSPRPGA